MQIGAIRIHNFLSIGDKPLEINPSPKMNVIVGPNNSGKTNTLRALTFVSDILDNQYSRDLSVVKPFFHNGEYSNPIDIEIKLTFNEEELEALANFVYLATLAHVGGEKETDARIVRKWLVGMHLKGLAKSLFSNVALIIRVRDTADYPYNILIKLPEHGREYYIQQYGIITTTTSRLSSYSLKTIIDLLQEEYDATKDTRTEEQKHAFPLNEQYKPSNIFSLISVWLGSENQDGNYKVVDIRGFNFNDDMSKVASLLKTEGIPEYRALRNFTDKRGFNKSGINLFELITLIYNSSIKRTSNIRSLPKSITITNALTNRSTPYSETTGENLAALLFGLKNSDDTEERKIYDELKKEFASLSQGYSFDVLIQTQKITRTTDKSIFKPKVTPNVLPSLYSGPMYDTIDEVVGEKVSYRHSLAIYLVKGNLAIPLPLAAAGLYEILYLLTIIIGQRNKILLLDEPALNLHPNLQRRILELVKTYSITKNGNQVILITHSPYLIDIENISNIWRISSQNDQTRAINLKETLSNLHPNDAAQVMKLFGNAEMRAFLFARGVCLVEGPSDKVVVEMVDKYLSSKGKGANFEANEVVVVYIEGKKSFRTFFGLAKELRVPCYSILDYDALMKHEGAIKHDNQDIRTSSIFIGLYHANMLTAEEIVYLLRLDREGNLIPHVNQKQQTEHWYKDDLLDTLQDNTARHNIYVLSRDLEGALQSAFTGKESKPLKALDAITERLASESLPVELAEMIAFVKERMDKSYSA